MKSSLQLVVALSHVRNCDCSTTKIFVRHKQELSGRSLLKAQIDSHGVVAAVIVETSSGHGVLDEAAVEDLRGWQFVRGDAESAVPALTIVRVPMRYEFVE